MDGAHCWIGCFFDSVYYLHGLQFLEVYRFRCPEGCVNFPTTTYIGCMSSAGCSHVEFLSNTHRGVLFTGGCEDGFVLVSFSSCDHLHPALISSLLPSFSCKQSVHSQLSQIMFNLLTPLVRVALGYLHEEIHIRTWLIRA